MVDFLTTALVVHALFLSWRISELKDRIHRLELRRG